MFSANRAISYSAWHFSCWNMLVQVCCRYVSGMLQHRAQLLELLELVEVLWSFGWGLQQLQFMLHVWDGRARVFRDDVADLAHLAHLGRLLPDASDASHGSWSGCRARLRCWAMLSHAEPCWAMSMPAERYAFRIIPDIGNSPRVPVPRGATWMCHQCRRFADDFLALRSFKLIEKIQEML